MNTEQTKNIRLGSSRIFIDLIYNIDQIYNLLMDYIQVPLTPCIQYSGIRTLLQCKIDIRSVVKKTNKKKTIYSCENDNWITLNINLLTAQICSPMLYSFYVLQSLVCTL